MKFEIIKDYDAFNLKFLDPEKVIFFRVNDALRVTIEENLSCLRVIPMSAFPISLRENYISLRDIDGNELGMIKDSTKLDENSRKLLRDELRKRYFTPIILKIKSLQEKFNIYEWDVETDRGSKKFFTKRLQYNIKETEKGYLITDLENNKYEIKNLSQLDAQSAALLGKRI